MPRIVGALTGLSARRAATLVFLVVTVVMGARFAAHGTDPTFFVVASTPNADPARLPADFALQGPGGGYDGQFFYSLAVEPLQHGDSGLIPLDNPPYRQQRLGYPLAAYLLALGSQAAVPWALLLVNLASMAAIAMLLARRAAQLGRPPIVGAALALAPGLTFATARDLAEPLALALVLGALAAALSYRWFAVGVLSSLAIITRETAVIAVIAILAGAWFDKSRQSPRDRVKPVFAALAPLVIWGAWQAYLAERWRELPIRAAPSTTLGGPLVGVFEAVRTDLERRSAVDALSLVLLVLTVAIGIVALVATRRSRAMTAEKILLVASATLALLLGSDVYVSFAGFTRALQDVVVFGGIVLLGASLRLRRAIWLVPLAWLPLAAYVIARP